MNYTVYLNFFAVLEVNTKRHVRGRKCEKPKGKLNQENRGSVWKYGEPKNDKPPSIANIILFRGIPLGVKTKLDRKVKEAESYNLNSDDHIS
jgi:hypothetical protein